MKKKKKRKGRGPQKAPLKVSVHYKIKPDLIFDFKDKCESKGLTQTEVIESLLESYLKRNR